MKFLSVSIIINYNYHPLKKYVLGLQILTQGNTDHQDVQSSQHLQADPHQENTQACGQRLGGKPRES